MPKKQEKISKLKKLTNKIKQTPTHITKTTKELRKRVRSNIAKAITAGFAFVIALFWRDAIKEAIDKILATTGLENKTYIYQIIAAIIVTIIAVIAIMFFSKWEEKEE